MLTINKLLPNSELLRNVKILVIENDCNSVDSYSLLLKPYGAQVTTLPSIKAALDILKWYVPDLLIYQMEFPDESVYPLIQQVSVLDLSQGKELPIFVTSRSSERSDSQDSHVKIEVYLLNPVDIDPLVYQVWNLMLRLTTTSPLNNQDRITKQSVGLTLCEI